MEAISFPWERTYPVPGTPRPEAHQPTGCFSSMEAMAASGPQCPPANCLGLLITSSGPSAAHHPGAEHGWGGLPCSRETRSRRRTFIPGGSLLWLGLQGESRAWKGTKERSHVSVWVSPTPPAQGTENKGCTSGTLASVTATSPVPLPPGGGVSVGLEGQGRRAAGPHALSTEQGPQCPRKGANCQRLSTRRSPLPLPTSRLGFLSRVIETEGNGGFLIGQP